MDVSIIVPMYNEQDNAENALNKIDNVMSPLGKSYEIIAVNDGSKDDTLEILNKVASKNKKIIVCNHTINLGLGNALKTGFKKSKGDIIIPIDADLSYDAKCIPTLIHEIESNLNIDIVTLSPYMKGGKTLGVPFFRLLISKIGNRVVSYAMSTKIHTVTCMVRAYRRKVIDFLDLDSPGPEILVEILAKALSLGFKVKEIPANLTSRERGKSKFKLKSGVSRHLSFSLYEKPMLLFGAFGFLSIILGLLTGSYIFYLFLKDHLDSTRPLMTLTVLLVLGGILLFFFGFISNQITAQRKELYKIQKEILYLGKK
jgi:glycosyltransferase involved in cell wall biosynthesis